VGILCRFPLQSHAAANSGTRASGNRVHGLGARSQRTWRKTD
jgi:hypothetical protein